MNNSQHRPYPAMVEFTCDLVDTPTNILVPDIVIELAAADADVFGTTDILNGPMPACFGFDFGQHFPKCPLGAGQQCDQAHPCDSGFICSPFSGCCIEPPNQVGGQCSIPGGTTCDSVCPCDFSTLCCIVTK
jgi:hypothetical protein